MADEMATSPRIATLSWGRVELEDGRSFKDAKLWPGGAREWDWGETGTHHSPGIQPADVQELIDGGARVIVLGRGQQSALGVPDGTLRWLEELGIETHVESAGEAVETYNRLRASQPVGALIHSTC